MSGKTGHGSTRRRRTRRSLGKNSPRGVPASLGPVINEAELQGDSSPRILIIEDHLDARLVMEAFLTHHGYRVSLARTGAEGLVLLTSGLRYDLVLLDLMLPGLGGLEILKNLRVRHGANMQAPVIIVSGFVSKAIPGVAQVLQKPIDLQELLASVAAAIGEPPTPRR
jgi:two-component system, OmpR family, response regulator